MKNLILNNKAISEFATFCRQNNFNIGVNITKDAVQLLDKHKVEDIDKAIYYLQFLFINNKKDIEKFKSLASVFFNRNINLQNNNESLGYEVITSHYDERYKSENALFYDYLRSSNQEHLKELSIDAILSLESLDLSRPVSINYWVERIMTSNYIEEITQYFEVTSNDVLGRYQIYELKHRFLNEIRDENSFTNPLSSYTPDSINLDVVVSEFEFYTAEKKVPFIQNNLKPTKITQKTMPDIIAKSSHTAKGIEVIEKHEVNDEIIMANNPFQKTINRIRDSEQKPSEINNLKQTPEFKITDTRGDELDGLINKSASVNSVSAKKTFNKKNNTISTKSKMTF